MRVDTQVPVCIYVRMIYVVCVNEVTLRDPPPPHTHNTHCVILVVGLSKFCGYFVSMCVFAETFL